MRTFDKSVEHFNKALKFTPGASQTGSKAPGRAGPLSHYPLFLDAGHGAAVRDLDGHTYLDFIASLAAVGIGHGDVRVITAIASAAGYGSLLSLPTVDEANAAERLCGLLGWPEQVRWVKTGSEATEAAVRIARRATGRDMLLTIRAGYHSWHSWFQAVKPDHPGVPHAYETLITGLEYGNRDQAAVALAMDKYAAVILEPAPINGGGDADYLQWLVAEARQHGTLVIFDEVVWGFRLALGGGTHHFQIVPDLATYGKAMGNGVPIGCVVGRADLMEHASVVSGTFGGDRLGLSAALAVMDIYEKEPIIDTMWQRGLRLQHGINSFGQYSGVQLRCSGYPVHPVMSIDVEGAQPAIAMSCFLQKLAQRGVLWHPAGGNVIAAHTESTIDQAIDSMWLAARDVALAAQQGPLDEQVGVPYTAAFSRATS